MKIYDCFLYNGEEKMLNFRLHELNDVVEKFLIVEGQTTFKGESKPLKFNIDKFEKFADKIVYKSCNVAPVSDSWANERNQRNFLKECFRDIAVLSNDLILLSDVDEIPDVTVLSQLVDKKFVGATTFYHNFYYYNINCRHRKKWPGTVVIDAKTFNEKVKFNFEFLRNARHSLPLIGEGYESGGWHFSYFGDEDYIIDKIKSFSHQEYNNPKYTNKETIAELIKSGKDLFFRDSEIFDIIEQQTYLPKFVDLIR